MNRDDFLDYASDIYDGTRAVMRHVPGDKFDWSPDPSMMSVGQLVRHLGSACGGAVKMVFEGNFPPMTEPMPLLGVKELESFSSIEEGLSMLDEDERTLKEMLSGLSEEDFQNRDVQPPWLPEPIKAWKFCLEMADHLSGHRMQLFQYLRILGVKIDTWTLYGMEQK